MVAFFGLWLFAVTETGGFVCGMFHGVLFKTKTSQLSAQVDLRDQMASVKGQVHRGDTTPLKSEVQELRFGKSHRVFWRGFGGCLMIVGPGIC